MFSTALIQRLRYRYGFPLAMSVAFAIVITAWPLSHKATSIWTFAIFGSIPTVFAILCGGQFRTSFVAVAVTPPFLYFFFFWFLPLRFAGFNNPIKAEIEYFLYFVAAPILVVWIVGMLLNREEKTA